MLHKFICRIIGHHFEVFCKSWDGIDFLDVIHCLRCDKTMEWNSRTNQITEEGKRFE